MVYHIPDTIRRGDNGVSGDYKRNLTDRTDHKYANKGNTRLLISETKCSMRATSTTRRCRITFRASAFRSLESILKSKCAQPLMENVCIRFQLHSAYIDGGLKHMTTTTTTRVLLGYNIVQAGRGLVCVAHQFRK